jgi:hypothetical protein
MNRKAIAMVMMLGMAVNYSLLAGGEEEAAGAGGAVMNAAGLPIVNETVTYTMWAGISPNWGDPSDGSFWREREAETNVAIDWITVGSSEAREKFNLMMSAGDYPDAFMTIYAGISDVDVINYGSQGVYIQLEELIQQYAQVPEGGGGTGSKNPGAVDRSGRAHLRTANGHSCGSCIQQRIHQSGVARQPGFGPADDHRRIRGRAERSGTTTPTTTATPTTRFR